MLISQSVLDQYLYLLGLSDLSFPFSFFKLWFYIFVCFSFFDGPYQLLSGLGNLSLDSPTNMLRQDWKCKQLTGGTDYEGRVEEAGLGRDSLQSSVQDWLWRDSAGARILQLQHPSMLSSKALRTFQPVPPARALLWGTGMGQHSQGDPPPDWLSAISGVGPEQSYGAWSPGVAAGTVSQQHSIHHGVWVVHSYSFLQEGKKL